MRRKPAVNTATPLIKRKKKQSSKHYYKEYSKLFLNYFNKLVWILPVVEKKKSRYGNKDIRSERNQQLKDKYQIYNEWRDRHFYLSTRISQLYGVMFCNCLIID